jgi:hypothetical protein
VRDTTECETQRQGLAVRAGRREEHPPAKEDAGEEQHHASCVKEHGQRWRRGHGEEPRERSGAGQRGGEATMEGI